MRLEDAIKSCRAQEKQIPNCGVVYRVYEHDSLIYIGKGGIAKRLPHGRLSEHFAPKHWSSFKHNYMVCEGWQKGISHDDRLKQWDALDWQFELIHKDELDQFELKLINEHRPTYNTQGVISVNDNAFKFIK
jgi:hypothetical protein